MNKLLVALFSLWLFYCTSVFAGRYSDYTWDLVTLVSPLPPGQETSFDDKMVENCTNYCESFCNDHVCQSSKITYSQTNCGISHLTIKGSDPDAEFSVTMNCGSGSTKRGKGSVEFDYDMYNSPSCTSNYNKWLTVKNLDNQKQNTITGVIGYSKVYGTDRCVMSRTCDKRCGDLKQKESSASRSTVALPIIAIALIALL